MTATCDLCGDSIESVGLLLDHLSGEHGVTEPVATWPDGDPVVVDTTLDPGDFR